MTGNTDWHAPKGTPKTKTTWWDHIRPHHEQGRRAFIAGVPKADNPLDQPYNVSWAKGWEAEERETAQRVARERERSLEGAPENFTAEYYDGWVARVDGVPVTGCDAHPVGSYQRANWVAGWTEKRRLQDLANDKARDRMRRQEELDLRYDNLTKRLSELGINPYQLRDYLADLPSEE